MRGGDRVGEALREIEEIVSGKSAEGNPLLEALAVDQGHGEEVNALDFFHRVNGDDVGVIESRE